MGLGMAAGGLMGTAQSLAAQAPQAQVQILPQADEATHRTMLEGFQGQGEIFKRVLGFRDRLSVEEARQRLQQQGKVLVELPGGQIETLRSLQDLELLDTLNGRGLRPNLPEDLTRSLRDLERGKDQRDGLFGPRGEVSAYRAYQILQSERDGAGRAAVLSGLGGLTLGAAFLGGGALLVSHGMLKRPQKLSDNTLWMAGAGLLALLALGGAAVGHAQYQAQWPQSLEIRNGQDSQLSVTRLSDVVEQARWLEERAARPFTADQQRESLEYLKEHGGLYRSGIRRTSLNVEDALERLQQGKPVEVAHPLKPGEFVSLPSLRHLQEFDTVHGAGVNPITSAEEMKAFRYLHARGEFRQGDQRLSGYEALDRMLRERSTQSVLLNGKSYTLANFREAQELNALRGDRINNILPENEFAALQYFDAQLRHQGKPVDSFEALQGMRRGQAAGVVTMGREAQLLSPTDAHELYSLEITAKNTILPEQQYELLQFWQQQGGYKEGRAYEALQALQSGATFEIRSARRWAPASSYQDMIDLAAFEMPQTPFPNSVPGEARERLEYFQSTHPSAFRVGGREGRAYEGYRQLRDGNGFEVRAGNTWNLVQNLQDLHELDAMLGRRVNDILPQAHYDLLHHLGDGSGSEGLATGGRKLNSYQALQAFQAGQRVSYDFIGGDFGELLQIPVGNLDKLQETRLRRDNQKEYDRYRYNLSEFRDKMQAQAQHLPQLTRADLEQGQSRLRVGQDDEARGQRELQDGESDLSRARSNKSWAEARLLVAYAMPSEVPVTRYRTVTNSDGTTSQESYTDHEHNYARDAAIASAQSDIWSAERQMRQAESEIEDARRQIREAQEAIRRAQGEIAESEELIRLSGRLSEELRGLDEAGLRDALGRLRQQVERMKQLAHTSTLEANLAREARLIHNQQSRPERPPGWKVPSPLAQ